MAIRLDDESTLQGYINALNFTGAGVSAVKSGITGTITIPGIATIGQLVSGGTANSVLFADASGNLGNDADFTYVPDVSGINNTLTLANTGGVSSASVIHMDSQGSAFLDFDRGGTTFSRIASLRFMTAGTVQFSQGLLSAADTWELQDESGNAFFSVTDVGTTCTSILNGTLNITSADTNGSVLFVDSSGNVAEDNGDFRYDQTNKNLILGVTNPATFQLIIGTTNTSVDLSGTTYEPALFIDVSSNANGAGFFQRFVADNVNASVFGGFKARGSIGSETIVAAGDNLFGLYGVGYDGVDYVLSAQIVATVDPDSTPAEDSVTGQLLLGVGNGIPKNLFRLRGIDNTARFNVSTMFGDGGAFFNDPGAPFTNYASASGDFDTSTVRGIHIDNALSANEYAACILEGNGGSFLMLADTSNNDDEKIFAFLCEAGLTTLGTYLNDVTGFNTQFMAFDHVNDTIDLKVGIDVQTVNGIDYTPGSDADCSIATVAVTDTPEFLWDESEDAFSFTKDVLVPDESYGSSWDSLLEVPTKNALYDKIQTLTSVLFTATASATVAGTATTDTTLVGSGVGSMTLAANFLTAGKTLVVRARGYFSSDAVASQTIVVKVKIGSTTVLQSVTLAPAAAASNSPWALEGLITCRTTGSMGTVFSQGNFMLDDTFDYYNVRGMVNTAATTIDTTASGLLDITAAWGVSDADNTITCTNITVEALN